MNSEQSRFTRRAAGRRALATVWSFVLLLVFPALAACAPAGAGRAGAPGATATAARPAAPGATTVPASVTYPLTLTDGMGRQVRLEKQPQRIVSYLPSNTETLYAIGAGDRIVGTDDFSDFPAEAKAKPKLGGLQVNLEQLIALQPDLVVTAGARPDFPTLLEPHQIPVVVLEYKDIPGTLANIELLGRAVGKPAEAARLVAEMRGRMEAVQARTRTARKVRAYYELDASDPSKPFTAGPGSFVHDLLVMAGAENIAAGATGQFPQISAEEVVRANPEVIIVAVGSFSPPDATSPARFAQRPGWDAIEAVKKGAIRGVPDNLVSRPGPRLVEGLEALAKAVHPELFP